MAGTGKSTIANTIANEFSLKNRLGASFFFSKGGGDRGRARMFFTTIAHQLAEVSPVLGRYICKAIAENPSIVGQGLSEQWRKLIFQPLSRLNGGQVIPQTVLLVIDALDECEDQRDIRLILQLFAESRELQIMQLRIFVTSRPEAPVLSDFRAIPTAAHQDFILHNISKSDIQHDISVFATEKLGIVQRENELSADWPGEQAIKLLADRACGLFIFIATACRFISKSKLPEKCLNQIIQANDTNWDPEGHLDNIYIQILTDSLIGSSYGQEKEELIKLFQKAVGSIVISFDVLSVAALKRLLPNDLGDIKAILRYLRSVLDVPDEDHSPIKLLHPSFRDFLLSKQRCQDELLWVDKDEAHIELCNCCLRLMSDTLHRDICRLVKPGALASEVSTSDLARYIPSHLQYACRYWVDHLKQLEHNQREKAGLYEKIEAFLAKHFLHWLEALSLMGKIYEGVLIITDLQSIIEVSSYLLFVMQYSTFR
jgi:hypothetical protein